MNMQKLTYERGRQLQLIEYSLILKPLLFGRIINAGIITQKSRQMWITLPFGGTLLEVWNVFQNKKVKIEKWL